MNDYWEPILREWVSSRLLACGCPIRTVELIEAAKGDTSSTMDAMRVTQIMRGMGWVRRRTNGPRGWWPGGAA